MCESSPSAGLLEACDFEFFTNGPAYRRLDPAAPDVLAQRIVDQRLVIPPAYRTHALAEVIENLVVQPD